MRSDHSYSQTEFASSSDLNHEYRAGTYVCAGCDLPLFKSDWKYNSRTGWPSFWQAFDEHLTTRKPIYAFRAPTEYRCARCDGHHGHIFEDGPPPTGLRYCSNQYHHSGSAPDTRAEFVCFQPRHHIPG